jgi:hypothetical protein
MVRWLLGAYAVAVLLILVTAAFVALVVRDPQHRADGYKVLKLTLGAVTGTAGVLVLLVQFAQ